MDNDHTQWIWVLNQNFPVPHDNVPYNFYISKWYRAQRQCLVILDVYIFVLRYKKSACCYLQIAMHHYKERNKQTEKLSLKFLKIYFTLIEMMKSCLGLYFQISNKKLTFCQTNFLHCNIMKLFMSICSILLSCHFS